MNCNISCVKSHPYKLLLALFIAVFVILGLYYSYNAYVYKQSMDLAQDYYKLTETIQKPDFNEVAAVKLVASMDNIKQKSIYANMGHFLLAKYFFDQKKYDDVANNLNQVLLYSANDNMTLLAYVRLVNLYIAKGDFDSAEKIISDKSLTAKATFAPAIYEAKGDFYLAQKNYKKAIESYNQVLHLDVSEDVKSLVRIKLQLLGVDSAG